MQDECLFGKIIRREIPAAIEYEDDEFIAFRDINPKSTFHLLLVPKKHIRSIAELKPEDEIMVGKMIGIARSIAEKLGMESGFRLVFNSGPDAGQEVDHLHLHILGGSKLGPIA